MMNQYKKNQRYFESCFPKTISEFIYSNLKESIMSNELGPNQRINEKKIAEHFHVSRTPVREAVLRLASEGFIKIDSYRRAVVKEVSYDELKEALEVLATLDVLAISLAVDKISPAEVNKLERLTKKMDKVCSLKTIEKFMKANTEFHNELWKSVPNSFLREVLCFVRDKRERCAYPRLLILKTPGFLQRSISHHWELMNAIKKRDKDRLRILMAEHHHLLLEPDNLERKKSPASIGEISRKNQAL